uniref:Carboxylic ester hydrolase n=1 Tax=Macrostomum lignano TaxID=282301 RepID=A0A1I8GL66_9PLAT
AKVLASKGIVMATLSYRLNIFGLISTGTYSAPGNLALWDQRAALMWIRDSVEFFGGDPGRVTLSGESAGGSSVGLHIVSNGRFLNGGRPLFHQAVLMSGADIANWAVSRPVIGDHEGSIDYIAGFVGCSRSSVAATMSCLASVSAYEIDKWSLKRREDTTEPEWLWAPVVDGVLIGDIPLIPGIEAIVEEAIKVYLQGKRSASSRAEMFQLMKNVTRDYEMIQPVYQALRFHANRQDSRQPVFLYEFGYEKRFQWPPEVRHGDDLDYILGVPFVSSDWWQRISGEADLDKFNKFNTTEQRRLSDFMTTLWTNFVKFGNPTPTPVRGFKWDRLTPRSNSESPVPCAMLNLPELTSVTPDYKRKEMQLWKRFYDLELQYVLQLSSGESSGATSAVLLAIGSAAALLARLLA